MSYEQPGAAQGPQPILRNVQNVDGKWFERVVFYRSTNPESRVVFFGQIDLLGRGRIPVFGFVNDRREGGKVISLTSQQTDPSSGEMKYRTVALGNVVNYRNDEKPVFFDTVIFNPVDEEGRNIEGAAPVSAWVTDACDTELHQRLGFECPRVPRPKREAGRSPHDGESDTRDRGNRK